MKKVLLASLIGLTLIGTTSQASSLAKVAGRSAAGEFGAGLLDGNLDAKDAARVGVHVVTTTGAVPTAVYSAGALGVEATTGTAIASLNGAAAVSATSYAIGAPVASALSTVGIVAAPAVVGGVIIVGAATLVAVGINELFFSDND